MSCGLTAIARLRSSAAAIIRSNANIFPILGVAFGGISSTGSILHTVVLKYYIRIVRLLATIVLILLTPNNEFISERFGMRILSGTFTTRHGRCIHIKCDGSGAGGR